MEGLIGGETGGTRKQGRKNYRKKKEGRERKDEVGRDGEVE